ncbi:MAG TPA: GxxExxY protein [Chloroflexia bacterium]|nr:GxxExxY protein [Chloroflexia bacterium]
MLENEELSRTILGAAIEVHRELGPGLLESAYEECLCYELKRRKLAYERQVELPVIYKGIPMNCNYRMDVVVENTVLLELKAVEQTLSVHEAQLLTYMKLSGYKLGLLINFNVPVLMKGVIRRVL